MKKYNGYDLAPLAGAAFDGFEYVTVNNTVVVCQVNAADGTGAPTGVIGFKTSLENDNFVPLVDAAGEEVLITVTEAGSQIKRIVEAGHGEYLRPYIKSGTDGSVEILINA